MDKNHFSNTGLDLEAFLLNLAHPSGRTEPGRHPASEQEREGLANWFANPYPDNGLGRHLAQFDNVCDRLLFYACLLDLLHPSLATRHLPGGTIYSYVARGLLKAERYHCKGRPEGPIFQPHSKPKENRCGSILKVRIASSTGKNADGDREEIRVRPAELDTLLAYRLLFGGFMRMDSGGGVIVTTHLPSGCPPIETARGLLSWAALNRGYQVLQALKDPRDSAPVDFPLTFLALLHLNECDDPTLRECVAPSSNSGPIRDFFEKGGLEEILRNSAGWLGAPYGSPPALHDLENAIFVLEHLKTFMEPIPSRLDPLLEKLKEARARLQP